jgi:hypothetical protein
MVVPRGSNPRLPSDLLGVTIMNYDGARSDGCLEAALGPASSKILSALKNLGPTFRPPSELGMPMMERKGMLSTRQRELLEQIEARAPISKTSLCSQFSEMLKSELHYRLEQLRLLQFIIVEPANDADEIFVLHPLYEYARRGNQELRTT